jgi:hypothetical protein
MCVAASKARRFGGLSRPDVFSVAKAKAGKELEKGRSVDATFWAIKRANEASSSDLPSLRVAFIHG